MRSPQMKALMARSDEYRHHNERTKDDLDLALRLFSRGLTTKRSAGLCGEATDWATLCRAGASATA